MSLINSMMKFNSRFVDGLPDKNPTRTVQASSCSISVKVAGENPNSAHMEGSNQQ